MEHTFKSTGTIQGRIRHRDGVNTAHKLALKGLSEIEHKIVIEALRIAMHELVLDRNGNPKPDVHLHVQHALTLRRLSAAFEESLDEMKEEGRSADFRLTT